MKTSPYPSISLVGAGPGDPELLTLKAYKRLQSADVVVYDRLVPTPILDLIPPGVTRIFAGKSCKQHFMTQEEINALLLSLAKSGRRVVRLKGGDPFIFGRGGEEADALAQADIAFEIVPGINSATGCSAYAGIPLTHRGLATGVRFLTGHTQNGAPLSLDWANLADPETTLVIYMGLANLDRICAELIRHGLSADFPAAAISNGTLPEQQRVVATLTSLPQAVRATGLPSPMLAIIGRVVSLAGKLDWYRPENGEKSDANDLVINL